MPTTLENSITEIGYTMYPVAYKFCKDTDVAEDIVQDTILKALVNASRYKEGTNLKGWIYTIMRNIFINEYRRKKRYFYMESANDFDIHNEGVHISGNDGISDLGCQEIQRQLDSIELKHTKPFLMHFDGYKYEEIAEHLSLPIGTVKNRIHIARKELQSKMARS